jgi:hypothetical protein
VDRVGSGGKGRGVDTRLHLLFSSFSVLLSLTMFKGLGVMLCAQHTDEVEDFLTVYRLKRRGLGGSLCSAI